MDRLSVRDVLSLKAFMILSANPLQNFSYILRCSRFSAVSIVEYLMKRYYSNPTKLFVEGQSWSCRRQREFNLRCEMVWFALSTKIAGAVFALLQADLFSHLIGIINDKRLCKNVTKNQLQFQVDWSPSLLSLLSTRNGTFNVFIRIRLSNTGTYRLVRFKSVCNLASRVTVFLGLTACFHSGVPSVLQICLYFRVSRSCCLQFRNFTLV